MVTGGMGTTMGVGLTGAAAMMAIAIVAVTGAARSAWL